MPNIKVEHLTASVDRALAGAEPFAAVPMFVAQVRWLDATAGRDLVEQIVTRAHPSTWGFDDALLDFWPPLVAERAVAAVRALSRGQARIEGLCRIAERLTRAEQREALEGVLDGTFREVVIGHVAVSRRDTIVAFVRTLPEDDREAWARAKAVGPGAFLSETLARSDVGILTDHALRDLWRRVPAPAPGEIPREYQRFAHRVPVDLRQQALATIREGSRQSSRLLHLAAFDEELTESERREVVAVPWNEYTRDDPRSQVFHLQLVEHHLPKVAPEVRHRWLSIVFAYEDPYVRQLGLLRLLPSLAGDDRTSAEAALVASVEQEGRFHGEPRWDLVPEAALDGLLDRLRDDPYAWHRDDLVAHLLEARPPSTADRLSLDDPGEELVGPTVHVRRRRDRLEHHRKPLVERQVVQDVRELLDDPPRERVPDVDDELDPPEPLALAVADAGVDRRDAAQEREDWGRVGHSGPISRRTLSKAGSSSVLVVRHR